ncbi:hypothetical protein HU200_006635 [Digitaria exilis]|uniref:Bifunctional lysine-specific demethylase and histidyl-hydroxylase n=1 Tax=Digitaria exilis TaxID=1010633 RepID=A0A835FQJ9_9POAL|nr:hypothetical protein HU200_006635 [Digitaria exilis]
MHPNAMDRSGKRKKRKESGDEAVAEGPSPSSAPFDRRVFPILLAAAQTARQSGNSAALAARVLRHVLSRSLQMLSPLPDSLVALLPRLLSSSCLSVDALSCELLGAAALQSMEAGEFLASDSGIASGLVRALGSRNQRVTEAACNSIWISRRVQLVGSVLQPHLFCRRYCEHLYLFSQVESICEFINSGTTRLSKRDAEANKISYLIIDTAVLLVNSCKVEKLQSIQQMLVRNALSFLYKIWKKVQLLRSSANCNNRKYQLQSRESEITKAIFRLSTALAYPACLEADVIRKSIFGQAESNFENFVLAYWEKSPNLYRRKQNTQNDDPVFAALHSAFNLGAAPDAIIESFIKGLASCPPIASDELDINSFLGEVHDSLGNAIKYRQDIRILRTQDPSDQTSKSKGCAMEEHFFNDGTVFLDEDEFTKKCKHAFKNGYSIALRGMEFRCEKVAAIASALADLFGQPSVGANIYFSPARSQGLARHYDDHCVLVWQLLGCKKWMIWPNPNPFLPRLYEPFDRLDDTIDDNSGRVEILHEEDMLYVPRGYVHEAHTDVGESQMNAYGVYSLHLTLAIEVEPPFEWEGFTHIALHCWVEKQKLGGCSQFDKSMTKDETSLYALVLHVAIMMLSDKDPIFRKACLVAAKLPSSSSRAMSHLKALRSSQRSIFDEIIKNIEKNCNFKEALESIKLAVQEKNDEPFQWMCWLRHLPQGGDADSRIDFCNIMEVLEEFVEAFSSNPEQALVSFTGFKSRFCKSVVYEDACQSFETLLQMYRTTRNQYMSGMLALHGAHVN